MDQDAGEIREAIDQTRDDIGQTLQAIGQKADIKGVRPRKWPKSGTPSRSQRQRSKPS